MSARVENVLAPRDATLTDEDDWEEFSLTDVKAFLPGKARYANILTASADNPLTVTGQLDIVEESQEHLVLDPDYRKKRILIPNVTNYAYGQHDEGEITIWAAADAGWFSISPARSYKAMFSDIVEAVDLLYFVADKYQEREQVRKKKKKGKNWTPKWEYLLNEYCKHTYGACEEAEDSAEIFYKHHRFLIKQMVQGREGIDWENTPLFVHFREIYPDVFEEAKKSLGEKLDGHMSDDEDTAVGPFDNTDAERSQARTVFETILEMKDAGFLSKRKLNLKNVAEELLKRYEMASLENAIALVQLRAEYILEMMDTAQSSTFDWSRRVIYRQLKESVNSNINPEGQATPLQTRVSDDEQDEEDEVPVQKSRRRKNRKSILRPKMSSVPAKGAAKRNRGYHDSVGSEDEDSDGILADETPTKQRGLPLLHEPVSTRINENTLSLISDSDDHSFRNSSTIEHAELAAASRNHVAEHQPEASSLPLNTNVPKDPSNVPSDAWACPIANCEKVVPKSGTKRSQKLIDDHILEHTNDTQQKIDLVFTEQRLHTNASIDNLLSRIRDYGMQGDDGSVDIVELKDG